jgi:cell division protein FtsI/penicillin-binding protein 2
MGFMLVTRIAYVQVLEHDRYSEMASDEHWGVATVEAQRGAIRDRNGQPLVTSVTTFKVTADLSKIPADKVGKTAAALSPLLNQPVAKVTANLLAKSGVQVLAPALKFDAGPKIIDLALPGIDVEKQTTRTFPEGSIAAPLIGIVGKDHTGLSGVEASYNKELTGRPGKITYERDTTGAEIPLGVRDVAEGVDGSDVILTIDRYIQKIADAEADTAMVQHKADGVSILVMEPSTGEVLAMATRPGFDLTKPNLEDPAKNGYFRNSAVSDMYEPGSIFKIFTMAAALEEKVVTPASTYWDPGWVMKYGKEIHNWDGAANGMANMTTLLVKSSNVGAVWVSDQLGSDMLYKYFRLFGFGQVTNVDLGGEAVGQLRMPDQPGWYPFDRATNSFGQGINVTPIQMITAISAIANGGKLMQPHVVKSIEGPNGSRTFQPVVVRRVISEETARTLRSMMVDVVNLGTEKAVVPGYKLSGKSGTTQVTTSTGYSDDLTVASFSVFPTDNPPFVVYVRVDRPKDIQWGGQVAAPIAKTMMERLIGYYRLPPDAPDTAN